MTSKNIFPQVNYVPTSHFSIYKGKKNFHHQINFLINQFLYQFTLILIKKNKENM